MIDRIIWNVAIAFILRQLEKFKTGVDWEKVKADLEVRVRKLVPGTWFDDEAVKAVHFLVDQVRAALGAQAKIEEILRLVQQQKWDEAAQKLKDWILGSWPTDATDSVVSDKAKEWVSAA